ncbi:hypothetical protein L1D31_18090 [Vibrio sp. Isolate23]|uniref:RHS repeat domain-containing protein n=1 Tax=Vibrio sp. Isolate23 TaxID=2908533 RepID=UPI001EFC611D|nr:RHS repeat-associated core domain-containing protein [Vibrio sp. Isolate23]MCG9684449.1 hypothetical protein [Vibrio sp. Isolate23]
MNEHDIGQMCQSTPTITVLDNRGLTAREMLFNRTWNNGVIGDLDIRITRHSYNAAGHLQTSIDPRFFAQLEEATTPEEKEQIPRNFSYITNLPGQQLRTDSIDAGSRITLTDVSGAPMLEWDERGTTRRFEYNDALHRPTTVIEQNDAINNGGEQVTERFVYGDSEPNASDNNLNGQLVRHYDNAGLREINSISLTNQPLSETRRLLLSDTGESDWQGGHEIEWEKHLEPDVADKRYTTSQLYNALGEVLQQTDAKGNRQRMTYYVSGRLQASYLTQAGESRDELTIVSGMEYGAHGQKLREVAGNGVVSEYSYDDKTLHLSQVKTTRPAKASRTILLQDLRYRYDPVGNILKIQDKSVAPRFYKNQQVSAENHYEYDALYQLTKAKGRENDSNNQQSASLPTPKIPIPSDSSQYTNYTRSYRYDRSGNLTQIQHNGASRYTHIIVVSDKTNRAVQQRSNSEPQITPDQVDKHFDNNGNLQKLEHSKALTWGRSDQLKRVDITNQQQEHYQYSVQGQRIRKTLQDCANTQHQQVVYHHGLEIRRNYSTNQSAHTLTEDLHVLTVGQAGRAQVRVMHWESGKPVNEGEMPNDQLRYSLDNHLGSSYLELNQDADVLTREEYYPFGGTAVWSAKSTTEAKYKTIKYSGKERDATGLYYYGHRYYQSWAGRWLNPDPAGTVDGLNLFRMVRNNPILFNDPHGQSPNFALYNPFSKESKKAAMARKTLDDSHRFFTSPESASEERRELISSGLEQLITHSNAEDFQSILEYAEGGNGAYAQINTELRSSLPNEGLSEITQEILSDITMLNEVENAYAYRIIKTPPSVYGREIKTGDTVMDLGIASASTFPEFARSWLTWSNGNSGIERNETVHLVYSPSVTKRNASTNIVADHVLIEPSQGLKVRAIKNKTITREQGGNENITFVYLDAIPMEKLSRSYDKSKNPVFGNYLFR